MRLSSDPRKIGGSTSSSSAENGTIHGLSVRFDGSLAGSCLRDKSSVLDGVISVPISGCVNDSAGGSTHDRGPSLREFLIGPENRLLEVVIQSVFHGTPNGDNPVVLYGPSGVGKSHLARGMATAWRSFHRARPVVSLTAVDFARHLSEAIEAQAIADFREFHLNCAMLVVEDIGRLNGKQPAQREFAHLLDGLVAANRRVVITASTAPELLPGLTPRLQSRLGAGLTVPLVLPSLETRLALLRRWSALRQIRISDDAQQVLAAGLCVTVPALFGALIQLAATSDRPIDGDAARRYLLCNKGGQPVELEAVAKATARCFSVRMRDLRSGSRRRAVVRARGVAMYLSRQLTCRSLNQIGKFYGGRDHTTVLYGCRRTAELLETEPGIRQAIQQIEQAVRVA